MTYGNLGMFKRFVRKYLNPKEKIEILEIGSKDEMGKKRNMVFRRYCRNPLWKYVGMDIVEGDNVDVISLDRYSYPFEDNSFDVVVCGSVLEHIDDIYRVAKEIVRISKKYIFIAVPHIAPEHKYPIDCWRFYPDGLRFLFTKVAKTKELECFLHRSDSYFIGEKYGS